MESFANFYKLILGNSGHFEEYEGTLDAVILIVYILATPMMIIVMLNLLISIIGSTFGAVSEVRLMRSFTRKAGLKY